MSKCKVSIFLGEPFIRFSIFFLHYVQNLMVNKIAIGIFCVSATVQEIVFECDLICIFGRMLSGPSVRAPSTSYTSASTEFRYFQPCGDTRGGDFILPHPVFITQSCIFLSLIDVNDR